MHDWLVVIVAAAGVVGQWLVSSRASARRDGVVDEKLRAHGYRILHLEESEKDYERRLSTVEGKLAVEGPHRRG